MEPLLTAIVLWLSANFSIPANFDHPRIEYAPRSKLIELRVNGTHSATESDDSERQPPDVVALYDNVHRTIILREGWSGATPAELSVLVHKMVHHLQNVSAQKFDCPARREKPTYLARDQWLKQFGRSLEKDFRVDMFTILVNSSCMF